MLHLGRGCEGGNVMENSIGGAFVGSVTKKKNEVVIGPPPFS